jgi:hypothetical protein
MWVLVPLHNPLLDALLGWTTNVDELAVRSDNVDLGRSYTRLDHLIVPQSIRERWAKSLE